MAATCHAQEDDLLSRYLQKRYNGLLTVRTRAIRGKGAWYWFHLEPILFQNEHTGTANALKLRCALCSALFSASNPSRTATEHLKRGTCPKFRNPETNSNGIIHKFRRHNQLALPGPASLPPLAMIPAPCSSEPALSSPLAMPQLTEDQIRTAFDLLAEWFYESCGYISFSTLDHPKFKEFLQHLGLPQVNKRYIFGRKLDTTYEEARFESENKLRDAMFFQISADGCKKEKERDKSADLDALVSVTLNLPNGSSLFHKVLFLGGTNPSSDDTGEVLWSTIKEVSQGDVFRCAGIVTDISSINYKALQKLEQHHHWMVNLTCQSNALHKLIKDFFKQLPRFASIASLCFKLIQIFKSNHLNAINIWVSNHQTGSFGHASDAISAIESISKLSHTLGQIFTEKANSSDPFDREISDAIRDSKFWEELDSVISLIKLIKTSLQDIEEDGLCLGKCLPLWEQVKSRIQSWCNQFNIEEKPVMEMVNRRFSKNYHQAWAASYVLDPLYLVEDSSGRYLPPFKFLTSEQEKDVVKIITRLTPNGEAHIALMELMKWRTQGLDPAYAQAVQAKERDSVTGKMKVVNPCSSRLVWETYLSEFKVLRKVAARLIFLQVTVGGLKWNQPLLKRICYKSHMHNTLERAHKALFVSLHRRLERGEVREEKDKDSELFEYEDDEISSDFLECTPIV